MLNRTSNALHLVNKIEAKSLVNR